MAGVHSKVPPDVSGLETAQAAESRLRHNITSRKKNEPHFSRDSSNEMPNFDSPEKGDITTPSEDLNRETDSEEGSQSTSEFSGQSAPYYEYEEREAPVVHRRELPRTPTYQRRRWSCDESSGTNMTGDRHLYENPVHSPRVERILRGIRGLAIAKPHSPEYSASEPSSPDERRRDPRVRDARAYDPRAYERRAFDSRSHGLREQDLREHDLRTQDARAYESRMYESRAYDSRAHESRAHESRAHESRMHGARAHDPRVRGQRAPDSRVRGQREHDRRASESRLYERRAHDPRVHGQRAHDSRVRGQREHDRRASESRLYERRVSETRVRDPRATRRLALDLHPRAYSSWHHADPDVHMPSITHSMPIPIPTPSMARALANATAVASANPNSVPAGSASGVAALTRYQLAQHDKRERLMHYQLHPQHQQQLFQQQQAQLQQPQQHPQPGPSYSPRFSRHGRYSPRNN